MVHKALPVGIYRLSAWSQAWQPVLTGTGCPWGPQGTVYGKTQAARVESGMPADVNLTECPCDLGGTAGVLSVAPSSTLHSLESTAASAW